LGFERDVKSLRDKVAGERARVVEILGEKKQVMRKINMARALLDFDQRLIDLEVTLGLKEKAAQKVEIAQDDEDDKDQVEWGAEWDDEIVDIDHEDYIIANSGISIRLKRKIDQYLMLRVMVDRFGRDHPFLAAEQWRIKKVRETVLLDIDAAIRAEPNVIGKQALMELRHGVED
jgi:conserved oligomeric Golgi complex subunit 2